MLKVITLLWLLSPNDTTTSCFLLFNLSTMLELPQVNLGHLKVFQMGVLEKC